MYKLARRIKEAYRGCYEDAQEENKKYLSQSDKRSIWYGGFMMSMSVLALVL